MKRSTKLTDRQDALKWCLALAEAQDKIGRGSASEAQLRSIISDTMEKITGTGMASPNLREWLHQWLAGKEGANSPNTLIRYRQAVEDFLNFLGQKALGRLESIQQCDIIDFRTFLREQGKSPVTIPASLVTMSQLLIARDDVMLVALKRGEDLSADYSQIELRVAARL